MHDPIELSIVVPLLNESATVGEIVRRVGVACRGLGLEWELILVDDGSTDGTTELVSRFAEASEGRVIAVVFNRNYGQHAAVMAGFAQSRGKHIVTLDGDLQNPPEEIPRVAHELQAGFDVVGTVRVPRQDSGFRRLMSRIVNGMIRRTTGVGMRDYGCMLRGYSRRVVDAILACRERHTFLPVLACCFAQTTTEIEVKHQPRTIGHSKYGLRRLIALQLDLATSVTALPLRVLSVLGVLSSSFGFALGILLLILRFALGAAWAAQGVFTLFAILFLFVGFQFIGMGLLGEYVARIFDEVRARPQYFVSEVVGASRRPLARTSESV